MIKLLSELKKEDELLLCCSRKNLEPENETKIRVLINENLDWNYIVQRATKNGLKPLLYWHLHHVCPEKIPNDILFSLKNYFFGNIKKNLLMYGELLRILRILSSYGVDVIPYKGPILSIEIYGNIALRDFSDLDIYVDKKDLLRLKQILLSESYESELDLDPKIENKYIDTQRELKFFNKELGVTLEVHWDFKTLFFSLPNNFHIFDKENSFINNVENVSIIQPSYEDMFLILAIHNASHRWSKISWISDINELVASQNINWSKIQRRAQQLSIEKILFINLYLAQDLLGLKIPDLIKKRSENIDFEHMVDIFTQRLLKLEYNSPTLFEEVFFSFKIRDNYFHGLKDVLKGLTNPTIYEWTSLPLPSFLWIFYYVYRPFNLIWRHKWK